MISLPLKILQMKKKEKNITDGTQALSYHVTRGQQQPQMTLSSEALQRSGCSLISRLLTAQAIETQES